MELLILFALTILQNASFTLVSRARNSGSLKYNALASVFSNGMFFFVFKALQMSSTWETGAVYIGGCTIGSVLMQWIAIRYLEKKKVKTSSLEFKEPVSEGIYGKKSEKGSTS